MTGLGTFLRHFVRRDRWFFVWFGIGSALLYVSQAWSVDGLYTTQAEFDRAAAGMEGNAALVAMTGPARALNTTGGQVTWQASAFGAIVAGLMVLSIVGRHTRAEEDSGRDELLRAAPVGRHATTSAALLDALIASVVIGLLVFLALAGYGLAVADSAALGVGLALCGWFFAATALVVAQLTSSARAAYGAGGAVIGAAYVLRAIGDVSAPALSWLSPIGWYQAMHPFSGLRWWPAFLLLGGAGACTLLAYAVFDRRDYGSGVLAARPGPARGGRTLSTGPGLAWRLQRPALLAWLSGVVLAGLCFGVLGDDVGDLVGDSDLSRQMMLQGAGSLVDSFYATIIGMLALLVGGFAVASALRPHAEEEAGRVEPLLATALPRTGWLASHVAVTVLGTAVALGASGAGLGASYALITGDGGAIASYALATLTYLPAVLVLSAVARLLHGALPRWSQLAWLGLLLAAVVLLFGEVLRLPQWLRDVSPVEHVPLVPAADFAWSPFLVLAVTATVLSLAGQVAFARRDLRGA